ncbi:MAG: hypothetical protein K9N51_10635 [Candidatus Pacebacteria bacterium]|nr:hypothetical protein [Candidatus Paceibacterota bacterium]
MQIDLEDLGKLEPLFHQLVGGYHLSTDDFSLYHELQDHETEYEQLFVALGYTLAADRRGFYYLLSKSDPPMNATTRKMALILFLLVEHLADEGRDPLSSICKEQHNASEIAAALWAKEPALLKEGGLASAETVEKCFVNNFESLGFARVQGDTVTFSPPIHRFLDICIELGRSDADSPEQTTATDEGEE